jgi:hypothetical protein
VRSRREEEDEDDDDEMMIIGDKEDEEADDDDYAARGAQLLPSSAREGTGVLTIAYWDGGRSHERQVPL